MIREYPNEKKEEEKMSSEIMPEIIPDIFEPELTTSSQKPKEQKKKQKNISIMFVIFKIIIGLVGIAFIYIGIKYNYYGNLKSKEPIDAFICSFAFMIMAIVAFEVWIFFWIKKNGLSWLFLFLYLLLFVFNTATILYYQYDKYQDKNIYSKSMIQTKKDNVQLNNIDDNIKTLNDELTSLKTERDRQRQILSVTDKDDKQYAFYYWNLNGKNGFENKIIEKDNELQKLKNNKLTLLNNSDIIINEKKELFSGTLLMIYFFIPSFTIELLASICLALLLFIKFK